MSQRVSALHAVDHLLLGTSDLDRGIAWFEERTGVWAARGGAPRGRGPLMAVTWVGRGRYLVIRAPVGGQPPQNLRMNLGTLAEPRLIAWAAGAPDLDGLSRRIRERGYAATAPRDGSRARPDGRVLTWRTLAVDTDLARADIDPIPFFIEWAAGSAHPSTDSPTGCRLTAFELEHPDAKRLEAVLAALEIDAGVRLAPDVKLVATLDTPKGRMVLT